MMEAKLIKLIREYYEEEKTAEFVFQIRKYFAEKKQNFTYYLENSEMHEILYNDESLKEILYKNKGEKGSIQIENEKGCIFCFYADGTNLVMKIEVSPHCYRAETEEELYFIAYVIEKINELKYYRLNAFISPFFYEISKIFYPAGDINIALGNFVQMFDDIFGVKIIRIENSRKIFFYREVHNEESVEITRDSIKLRYILERKIDSSIELEKVFKVAMFILNTYLESKVLEDKQKEFLEYQIVSKENLAKLNRLLEKSLYKMTFISNLYKKLSQVRNIKEALSIVQKFLKNEVGYDYLKIECGNIKVEDGILSEKCTADVFEDTLMENSVMYRISLYKGEISSEENVYIGLIFNNSKVEIENILLYKRLEEVSIIDGVTQLYLHRYFIETLDKEIAVAGRYGKDISLIMCDIDNFKKYNDTFGHLEGDKALYNTASVIKETIRKVDIACRYGGEEFIIILPHTGIENAYKLSERIRKNIEEKTKVTVSVGVVEYIANEERDSFIKRADQAMYEAKKSGKNQVIKG